MGVDLVLSYHLCVHSLPRLTFLERIVQCELKRFAQCELGASFLERNPQFLYSQIVSAYGDVLWHRTPRICYCTAQLSFFSGGVGVAPLG